MVTKNEILKISPNDLKRKINETDGFVLIDVLPNDHFNMGHLPGAKNACVFEVTFLDNVAKIVSNKDQEIVVYGSNGKSMDAVTAAEKLVRAGYKNVKALEGGILEWSSLEYVIEGKEKDIKRDSEEPISIENKTYRIDLDQSLIEWTGRNPNSRHHGTVQLSKGEILVHDDQIGGTFEIDMRSIKNINLEGDPLQPILVSHLMSDDFFFVDIFPRATFTITSAKQIKEATPSEPNFKVKGIFELRGVKKELAFVVTVSPTPEGELKIEAHFDIDRTGWNIIYGSSRFFEHLGMHLVFDLISIQLNIVAR
jgi:rhodanese-related sulfurtransferase/polyisoprenoid-binding protein YceI